MKITKQANKRIWIILAGIFMSAAMVLNGLAGISVHAADASENEQEVLVIDPYGNKEGYSAVLYNGVNGLPTSESNAIAETEEGFIWIGSYSGLIRYDGNTFERVDSTNGIASVVSLFVDHSNRLWIGTNDSGIAVMEKGVYQIFNKAEGLKSSSVRCIAEDDNGLIYAGTSRGVVTIDSDMNLSAIDDERVSEQYIRRMEKGGDGIVYGVTQDGAVFGLEEGKVVFFLDTETLGLPHVRSIEPDEKNPGYVYLGTQTGELYYGMLNAQGLQETKEIDVSPLIYINDIKVFDTQTWVCADNGIGILQGDEIQVLDNIPMNDSVEHLMVDYSGNAWFTSSRQGVMKIVRNQFSDIFERFSLPEMVVNTTYVYDDLLFVGSDKGLTVLDQQEIIEHLTVDQIMTASGISVNTNDLIDLLDGCRIRSLMIDAHNRLWIATYSSYGLLCYDGSIVTCYTAEDGMTSERVRTSFETMDGTILAPCSGGGVIAVKDGVASSAYNSDNGLSNADILTIAQADNGDLIFGSDGDGIYVVNANEIKHINTDNGLASDVIMRIRRDSLNHVYWIVTSNSLAWMDEDYNVTTINKFPYSNNFDLYENGSGDMWILSSNGIYVATAEELLANEEIVPVFYGRDNGLPTIATANSYSCLTDEGDLYIAGTSGVAKVNIKVPFEDVSDLKMSVPYVEADGTFIYPDEEDVITVPSDVKRITIYCYVYNYSLLNPQVSYYLEGFETDKVTVKRSELVPINYTNLSGGSYRFVMELKDAMGRGGKEMSVEIIKEKAVYEHLWFRVIAVLCIIGLIGLAVWAYIRYKTRAYERKAVENKALINEMTEAFAKVIDMKDKYTNGHSMRVAEYTAMLARELGYDEETVDKYYNIALLHDIGKIGVPPEVLNKPGKLTDEEFNVIKSHSSLGYNALKDISIMPELAVGAGCHHERPDGKGYPRGLKGDEIPRVAQIIAVADTFDAMYSDRPYRKRMNFDKVVEIIESVSGTQLTSDVVDAFIRLVKKGEFRDPDDDGGGTLEDIDNIHKKFSGPRTVGHQ